LRGDNAASTGAVFDDELLSKPAGQLISQHPHADIGYAAGGIGNDQADRARRIIALRLGRARRYGKGEDSRSNRYDEG
jgi:hypothetical protein